MERLNISAEMDSVTGGEHQALSYLLRESASGYLDWLLPAFAACHGKYDCKVVSVAELAVAASETVAGEVLDGAARMEAVKHADPELLAELAGRFAFSYPHQGNLTRKNKYSVSELKHRAMRELLEQEEEELKPAFMQEDIVPYKPAFVQRMETGEESVNQGALRGTAVHRVMECYDFSSDAPAASQVETMLSDGKITADMAALVRLPLVETFLDSDIGARMRAAQKAGRLYREKPFVMGFTADELAQFGFGDGAASMSDEETLTLIQGLIDVFWIEEDGIVVLDYKTDRVDTAKELKDRYAAQLAIYGEALERIYNAEETRTIRVKERLLYSFRLGEVIPV